MPSNLHDTLVFALCMGRDKCTEESHCRADARCHRGTPQLNSSEGIKYAHKTTSYSCLRLRKKGTEEQLSAGKGDPACYVSSGGPVWL